MCAIWQLRRMRRLGGASRYDSSSTPCALPSVAPTDPCIPPSTPPCSHHTTLTHAHAHSHKHTHTHTHTHFRSLRIFASLQSITSSTFAAGCELQYYIFFLGLTQNFGFGNLYPLLTQKRLETGKPEIF